MAQKKVVVVERVATEQQEQELVPIEAIGFSFEPFCNPETLLMKKEEDAGTLIRYAFCPN